MPPPLPCSARRPRPVHGGGRIWWMAPSLLESLPAVQPLWWTCGARRGSRHSHGRFVLGTGRSRGPARLVIVSEAVTRALLSARLVPRIRSDLLGSACVQQGVAATCSAPLAAVNMLRLLGVWRTVQAQRARRKPGRAAQVHSTRTRVPRSGLVLGIPLCNTQY